VRDLHFGITKKPPKTGENGWKRPQIWAKQGKTPDLRLRGVSFQALAGWDSGQNGTVDSDELERGVTGSE